MDRAVICVPIEASLYNQLVLRMGDPEKDVVPIIEHAVQSYLERTQDDRWSEAYESWRTGATDAQAFESEYGDPKRGYQWGPVFLPNGTKIQMPYRGQSYNAEVRHEQIWYRGKTYSPAELASVIANNTSRNAWRDLYIRRPTDSKWHLANSLRGEVPSRGINR